MTDKKDDGIEFFQTLVETQGVACSTVSDGHVLMFKRKFLQAMQQKLSFDYPY